VQQQTLMQKNQSGAHTEGEQDEEYSENIESDKPDTVENPRAEGTLRGRRMTMTKIRKWKEEIETTRSIKEKNEANNNNNTHTNNKLSCQCPTFQTQS
jgi:hypothetical protein